MTYSKQYTKDLTKITSVRLSENLLNEGIQRADSLGLSFSDFIRQSLTENIKQSVSSDRKDSRQAESRSS
jgi:predicted DNA binding CopG/RHH family protein